MFKKTKISCVLLITFVASLSTAIRGQQSVDFLSFNVWQEGTSVSNGLTKIKDVIIATNPDVVCFSEVRNYSGDWTTKIINELAAAGYNYNRGYAGGDISLISKFPIVNSSLIPQTQNAIAKFELQLTDQNIIVACAHLDYTNYGLYLPRGYNGGDPNWNMIDDGNGNPAPVTDVNYILNYNMSSSKDEQIAAFLNSVSNETKPIILLGDFNDASHLDWTANTSSMFDHNGMVIPWQNTITLENNGFVDSYRTYFPNEVTHPGISWPSYAHGVGSTSWTPKSDERDRIDYIFYKGDGIQTTYAALVGPKESYSKNQLTTANTGNENFLVDDLPWPSDHKAIFCTLSIDSPVVVEPTDNLIVNSSAESDPFLSGWVAVATGSSCFTASNWRIEGNQNGFPGAKEGTYMFYAGCDIPVGEIYQDVDVSSYASQIDSSTQEFTFTGYTQSYNQTPLDEARIVVEYRNDSNVILTSYDTNGTTNLGSWGSNTNTMVAPVGTRTIRVRLIATTGDGPSNDGYFDDLSLTTETITVIPDSDNLIINPSAESNPLNLGWTLVAKGRDCYGSSNWRARGNRNGFPRAEDGRFMFYAGCDVPIGEIYQDVDVSTYAALIDNNSQSFSFSGHTQSYNQTPTDEARIIVEYRDNSGTVLTSYDTNGTTNIGNWGTYDDTTIAPVNTRTIRIRLIATTNGGSSNDGFFDDLSLIAKGNTQLKSVSSKIVENKENLFSISNERINMYPNPTKDRITIETTFKYLEEIKIYNVLGNDVTKNVVIKQDTNTIVVDMSALNTGLYFYKERNKTYKIYKQ